MKGTPSKTGKKPRDGVNVDGQWFAMPADFLASRAFAELSPLATKMLMLLASQLRSRHYGNGRLDVHERRLRRHGWQSRASAMSALQELIDAGLVVCTRHGRKGCVGLYAITLFPMHCGDPQDLDHGPGAWSITEWRDKPERAAPPTDEAPATWARPRGGEKRKASPRCGTESAGCSPAAGQKELAEPPCSPAAGQHEVLSARNSVPQRDSPLRYPSARTAALPAMPAQRCRLGIALAQRIKYASNPAHRAAVLDVCRSAGLHRTTARQARFIIPESLK